MTVGAKKYLTQLEIAMFDLFTDLLRNSQLWIGTCKMSRGIVKVDRDGLYCKLNS